MSDPTLTPTPEATTAAIDMYSGSKSILIMIIGKPGRGKSYSMRNLPPSRTHLINIMGKPLPFPKGLQYREKENLTISADCATIRRAMQDASRNPDIDYLVIDDAQYQMASSFMDKALVKGYEKFTIMARDIWEILILGTKLRGSLKVFFLTHEDDTGTERKMKTLGKLLEDKISPEGLSSIVMYSEVSGDKENRVYCFTTQSDGITNAKTPPDMFPARIDNDLLKVAKRIDEYYMEIPLKNTKIKLTPGD